MISCSSFVLSNKKKKRALAAVFLIQIHYLLHIVLAPQEDGRALVDSLWLDVQNRLVAVHCHASRLLDQERHRVAFVEQTKFSVGGRRSGGVHEDAPVLDGPVHVSDQ